MTSIGIIKTIEDEFAEVNVVRRGSCGENCAACNACQNTDITVKAHCNVKANVGDLVEVSSKTAYVLFGMLMVFIFPIIVPLFSYVIFSIINTYFAVCSCILSLIICVYLTFKLSKSKKYLSKTTPSVTKIIFKN